MNNLADMVKRLESLEVGTPMIVGANVVDPHLEMAVFCILGGLELEKDPRGRLKYFNILSPGRALLRRPKTIQFRGSNYTFPDIEIESTTERTSIVSPETTVYAGRIEFGAFLKQHPHFGIYEPYLLGDQK